MCACAYVCVYVYMQVCFTESAPYPRKVYGVATISRLLKIIGLFCKVQSLL